MSYIGAQTQNLVSPQFHREVVTGTGTDVYTLVQDVPGFNADNITVVVNNVLQEPNNAYTITADSNGNPRVLNFNGTNLAATDSCYVQHKGIGTLNITPAAGSVNAAALQDNLRSGNVDTFTATANQTEFTLSETPLNAQSISVFLGGVYQRPTTNYTVATNVLTLTSGANVDEEVDVHHHTIRSTVTHVADGSVTSGKLDTNIQVAGTLGVTGATTLTGAQTLTGNTTFGGTITGGASTDIAINTNKFTVAAASGNTVIAGNLTVSGTTTTIDTTLESVDKLEVGANSTDYGAKINQAGTGNILQLQDGGVDKVVVADGGNTTFSGNVLVDTIAEKTSANGVAIDGVTLKDGGGTFTGNLVIPNAGTIGSVSDTNAIAIAADGKATFSAGIGDAGTIDAGSIGSAVTGFTGIKVVDQWRIDSHYSQMYGGVLDSNWSRADNDKMGDGTNALIGGSTKMTESSGVFKFPLTGIWRVFGKITMQVSGGTASVYVVTQVSTNNGGAWGDGELVSVDKWVDGTFGSAYLDGIFDIDNVANSGTDGVCVKFSIGGGTGSIYLTPKGSTTEWYSGVTFVRLGDT